MDNLSKDFRVAKYGFKRVTNNGASDDKLVSNWETSLTKLNGHGYEDPEKAKKNFAVPFVQWLKDTI